MVSRAWLESYQLRQARGVVGQALAGDVAEAWKAQA